MENDTVDENKFIIRIATYQGMRLKEITQLRKKILSK